MAETKRKRNIAPAKRKKGGKEKMWKKGPHLPNALQKELDSLNPKNEEVQSDDDLDLYEYEEKLPDEELKKNRRYDPVENFEYELPEDFEDEDVASDDDDGEEGYKKGDDEDEDEDDDDHDDEKHARMLQDITGLPGAAFEGKKKKNNVIVYESYPEAENNPTHDINNDGHITINDLLNPLHGKAGFSKIRKDVERLDKKSKSTLAPLPKPQQEKIDRRSTYVRSKKELTKFEPLVKKNREAPTIYFNNEDIDVGYSTVGAIASEFRPRTEFEKKMDSLINIKELSDAHQSDGARLLELNKVSAEDVKERQDRLAKMRNLLFRHELKSKRIKHIKSKTYRRLLKKDKSKAGSVDIEMDPEAAKEIAEKQEFKRAEERMTLKHKNTSKWAKRIKKRGFDVQDDGTRAAISEQLQQHALLIRKRNSMHDDDDSDDVSMDDDDDDDVISGDDDDEASKLKLLEKGKKRTLEVLDEDEDTPKSGLLSLPFMVRGQKKKKDAADEEARLALQEFDSSLKQLEGEDDLKNNKISSVGGRKVFGAQKKQVSQSKIKANNKDKDNYFDNTDSEDDADITEDAKDGKRDRIVTQKDVTINTNVLREKSEVGHDPLFDDISKVSGPNIAYEVSLFSTNTSKKKRDMKDDDSNQIKSEKKAKLNKSKAKVNKSKVAEMASNKETDIENGDEDSDTDVETRMVDGVITSGTDYELPSQEDLIKRAFAGDDVEEDFEMLKQEVMNEENPEPEKPVLLPGWGQWTRIQKKRGLPSWMVAEHERAKKKRDEDLKKRPDAHLKHVIISEKVDKKAEKLQIKVLPFPYKNKEHFEQSNRMPLGPEFNPATALGALNRPEVVKKSGVSIKPIKLKKGMKG